MKTTTGAVQNYLAQKLALLLQRLEARLPQRFRWILHLPAWAWGTMALAAILLVGRLAGLSQPARPAAAGALPAVSLPGSALPNTTMLVFDAIVKLGIVLGLFFIGVYVWKGWRKFLPNQPQRQVTLVETTRLSQRQALHLVRGRRQLLLIGATDQGLSLLTKVEDEPAPEAVDFSTELAARQYALNNTPQDYFEFSALAEPETR